MKKTPLIYSKYMKKLLFIFAVSMTIYSIYAKDIPPADVEAAFANSNPETTISSEISGSLLIPKILSEYDLNTEPSLFREKIFYIQNDKSMSQISQILRSISTMEGIKYYSTGSKKWETLYEVSTFIDSPESKNPIGEEQVKEALSSDGKKVFCLLEDHSLGTCIYELSYFERENEIAVNFHLVEPIKLGPVKAVKADNLVINLVVIKENNDIEDNKLTLYMNVKAKYVKLSMIENRLNKSFERRIDSMYTWFEEEISK